ncbi:MAG: phasin family protein [Acidimicrobiales bacterium]
MAQNPLIKRYLDAGIAFTQMTQARAEAIVKDLVSAGEVQAQRAEELVSALVERSRQNTDRLLEVVRKEVRDQIANLGLATKGDVARVERKVAATPAKKSAAKKAGTKKSAAKKAGTKKSAAKKSAAKKSAAKKSSRSRTS